MTPDEQMAPIVESWLEDSSLTPAPAEQSVDEVMSLLPQTRQLGRWRWLPSFQRTQAPVPTTDRTTEFQPTPIPATNGRSPTVLGRTQSMFSPAKAITAGALVFAIGGVLLIAQPFDQQGASVPGAATDTELAAPIEVTGTLGPGGCSRTGSVGDETTLPGSNDQYTCTATWSMSDPRLSGSVTLINDNVYLVGNGLETSETLSSACAGDPECEIPDLETLHSAESVENDDGVWRQRPSVQLSYPGSTSPDKTVIVLDGEQGYDGLVAVLEVTGSEEDTTYYGFILDARQLAPAPENASAN
jgi:hypothetical protein